MSRLSETSALARTPEQFGINVQKAIASLARCTSVPAARDLRDKAKTIAIYAQAKKAGVEAENEWREVALRAERRIKEIVLDETDRARPGRPKKNGGDATPFPKAATLAELKIDKEEAKRLRQHSTVSDEEFEDHLRALREAGERLTLSKVAPPPSSKKKGYDGDESYTPSDIIEDVRYVMGEIDLDPFSCALAQQTVKAKRYYTKDKGGGGLMKHWDGRVWFQPPYSAELIGPCVEKLLNALAGNDDGHVVDDCVGLTNQSEAAWWHRLARRATRICQTGGLAADTEAQGRINFAQPDGKGGVRGTKNNRYAQTFFYFGSRIDRFEERFEKRGTIFTPCARRSS